MNHDPLNLANVATPEILRQQRAAPLPYVTALNRRITNVDFRDSLEVKVMLLSQMVYGIYADLKETQTK